MTIIFWIDEKIDPFLSGLQIDVTSTSPAESPSPTDDNTWGDGDEEGSAYVQHAEKTEIGKRSKEQIEN